MIPHLIYYQLVILILLWLCVMLPHLWPSPPRRMLTKPADPLKPKRKRSTEPNACEGLTYKPPWALGEHETAETAPPPPVRPEPLPPTNRRPRTVDTAQHCCPQAGCRSRGWRGLGNWRANGHPRGGPWRPCQCTSCEGSVPAHHGPMFHGTQVPVELLVRVLAC